MFHPNKSRKKLIRYRTCVSFLLLHYLRIRPFRRGCEEEIYGQDCVVKYHRHIDILLEFSLKKAFCVNDLVDIISVSFIT